MVVKEDARSLFPGRSALILEGQLDSQATETAQSCSGVSRTVNKFASTPPIETTRQGLRRRGRRARTDNPQLPIRTGGQARVLGEEKEEGTSGFVELDTADPQERVNAPVKSCGLRTSEITISHTSPLSWHQTRRSTAKGRVPRAGQLRTATVPSGEQNQRVAADRP